MKRANSKGPHKTATQCFYCAKRMAVLLCTSLILEFVAPESVFCADDGSADLPALWAAQQAAASAPTDNAMPGIPQMWVAQKAMASPGPENATLAEPPAWGAKKSYIIPAFEIIGWELMLNQFDRHFLACCDYNSNLSTIRQNLHGGWVVDSDGFTVNQLGHPYGGSMYFGFARSSGLGFGESMGYAFAGSALWEIAGEQTPPSKNDQIMTTLGGSFLGESLFRMSNLILENGDGAPSDWREASAAAVSPTVAFNRAAFGDRFHGVFDSHSPEYYSRFQAGGSSTTQNIQGSSTNVQRNEALLDYSLDYGLPGKPGYTYTRPFDYFNFQAIASSADGLESVNTRGLLVGKEYKAGETYRGVWGLYGTYDYFAPQLFRVSSTGLSIGTTGQWGVNSPVQLQGTGLLGAGYTAVGTINDAANSTDNHYGVSPQALLALRFIFGDTVSLDLTAREYFVTSLAGGATDGHDNIVRADASLTWRIYKQQAIALKYLVTRRDETTSALGAMTQSRGTIGIFYTFLGRDRFGAVDWLD